MIELHFRPDDLQTAFRYKSDKEIHRTKMVFGMMRFPVLVRVLSSVAIFILKFGLPFRSTIRNTVFKVFCSGENIREALKLVRKLETFQVLGVLDYVAEGAKMDKAFDYNARMAMNNINKLKNLQNGHSISLKLSGLEDVEFIKRIGLLPGNFPGKEEERYARFINRVDEICSLAASCNILVYIDAEEYSTLEVFDEVAELMMSRYNRDKVIVYNTLQMYLKDRTQYLERLIKRAERENFRLGIKLVRGAYMEKERSQAVSAGLEVPVFDTKEETDQAFDKAVEHCLNRPELIDTCIATHNEKSVLLALNMIEAKKLDRKHVRFSQLYGMSDHLTFNLAFAGYSASKYLPYGTVEKAIPYLIRRAEENTSIGGQVGRELSLLNMELKRRNQYVHPAA